MVLSYPFKFSLKLNTFQHMNLAKGYCKNQLLLAYPDPEKGKMGMLDDTPMPLVLRVSRENGKLNFEQTEYTKKYLGM